MYEDNRKAAKSARHPALRPLLEVHDVALELAEELARSASFGAEARRGALARFRDDWHHRIAPHLTDEDELLLPLVRRRDDRRRLQREHRLLRDMALRVLGMELSAEPDPVWVGNLGSRLASHVRWEERELFPYLESRADAESLEELRVRLRRSARRREPRPPSASA